MDEDTTYSVVEYRECFNHPRHQKVIHEGLSLEDAQAHCRRPDTSGDGWFHGYRSEG